MPSLYPIGFSALITGYLLSRVRWNELLLHPIALLIGASLVLLQLMAVVPGGTPAARVDEILDRMYAWWSAVTQNGISSDTLPFIVLTDAKITKELQDLVRGYNAAMQRAFEQRKKQNGQDGRGQPATRSDTK